MVTTNDYALLSNYVYRQNISDINKLSLGGTEWKEKKYVSEKIDRGIDFSAGVYEKGNEIVIAFTGEDTGFENDAGKLDTKKYKYIYKAIDLVIDVLKDPNNAGKNISFTGHGLGAGIASVMSVFFDKKAEVFAQTGLRVNVTHEMAFIYGQYVLSKYAEDSSIASSIEPFLAYCDSSIKGQKWREYKIDNANFDSILYNLAHYDIFANATTQAADPVNNSVYSPSH